jgi:manganese efflux pump family protein
MKWAALITWVLTAGGGFVLLSIWLARGGMRQSDGGNRIRPPLILSHFLLAAAGLVVWIVYLVSDTDALKWIALVVLAIVAALGWTMFAIWLRRRQARAAVVEAATPGTPAEQHFPVPVVALHGVLAVTTVVLVFLTAIGVGD